jgi:hypothetical protein
MKKQKTAAERTKNKQGNTFEYKIRVWLPMIFLFFLLLKGYNRFNFTDYNNPADEPKKDLIGVGICIFNFSVAGFILIMIET